MERILGVKKKKWKGNIAIQKWLCCPCISTSNSWRVEKLVNKPQIPRIFLTSCLVLNRQLRYSEKFLYYLQCQWLILIYFGHFSGVLWSLNWTIKNKCCTVFSHKGHWCTWDKSSLAGSMKSEGASASGPQFPLINLQEHHGSNLRDFHLPPRLINGSLGNEPWAQF